MWSHPPAPAFPRTPCARGLGSHAVRTWLGQTAQPATRPGGDRGRLASDRGVTRGLWHRHRGWPTVAQRRHDESGTERLLSIPVPAFLCMQDVKRGAVALWVVCGHREGHSQA